MPDETTVTTAKPGAEDMFEIFYAPSAVYERRRGGEYGLPLVALAVTASILFIATRGLLQPVIDAETAIGMVKTCAKLTPEQCDQARSVAQKYSGIGGLISVPIIYLVMPFILGCAAWLAAMAVGVRQRYGVAVMIATFAWYPRLVESVVGALQLALLPNLQVTSHLSISLGLGRFLDGTHPSLTTALLGRVDVFTLWVTFLIGLGFMVTAKATRAQAIMIGAMVWVVGALPGVWQAVR
jgi:hypothetical protein